MKKRIFDRILSVVGIILALCFAAVLLATIFGGIEYKEFDNSLVKGLFVAMTVLYLGIAVLTLINLFSDGDVVKEIALDRSRSGSTKVTSAVIKSLTKKYIKEIEGVKCTRVTLILTEYGVNLRINLKVRELEVKDTTIYIKKLLDDIFDTTLDYRFHSIDFKVQSLKSSYAPPQDELRQEAEQEVAKQREIKLRKEAEQREIEARAEADAKEIDDIARGDDQFVADDAEAVADDAEAVADDAEAVADDAEAVADDVEAVADDAKAVADDAEAVADDVHDVPPMNADLKEHEMEELDQEHFPRT